MNNLPETISNVWVEQRRQDRGNETTDIEADLN